MKARLISYSKPSEDFAKEWAYDPNLLDLVSFCARVSNPSNQFNNETSEKLIRYLIKHSHWSPLESVSACIEIETTRDIAHQIVRHRSFSFQEFSQRYANPDQMGDQIFEFFEARVQDEKNRQNSIAVEDFQLQTDWQHMQQRVAFNCKKEYDEAIRMGIAKELARKLLPEGLTKTRLYMNGTLRSWVHYIELRASNGTQKEHMDVARACAEAVAKIFPMASEFVPKT
jgi:thymidylate synthase (FAD)